MTEPTIDLLPCPFCGGDAEFGEVPYERKYAGDNDCRVNHDHGGQFIQCKNSDCYASSMLIFPIMDDAKPLLIENWNRRASLKSLDAQPVPVEPELVSLMRKFPLGDSDVAAIEHIDALQSALKLAQEERDNEKEVRNCISRAHEAEQKRAEKAEAALKLAQEELEKANNEFGSQTAAWPDLWKRIAEIKQYSGEQWRRAEKAEALAEQFRKDAERYRWLVDKVMACDYGDNDKGRVGWIIGHCKGPKWIEGLSIDAAIDSARAE